MEYDPFLTMSALNMAVVSLHRITSSGDRLILDREYTSIISNIRMGEINADPELTSLYQEIMRVIHGGRLRDDARAEIENEYSDRKRKSIREIISGNILKSFSTNPLKWLGKLAMSSASEYFTSQNQTGNDEKHRLKRDELSEYDGLQRRLLDSSWKLLRQYGLQDDYRITQDGLMKFSEAMKESDPSKRHRMLKYLEREFSVYAPYWFYRAESLRLSGDNGGAEEYFAKFAEVWRPVLRKDPYMAEYMKFKIEGLMRGGINPNNAGEILKCLEVMRANSPIDEWANNIYMGMVYFALGYKDKAEECVMCNIDFRFETETSGRLLAYFGGEILPEVLTVTPPEPPAPPVIESPAPKKESQKPEEIPKRSRENPGLKSEAETVSKPPKPEKLSRKILRERARHGDPEAKYQIARSYDNIFMCLVSLEYVFVLFFMSLIALICWATISNSDYSFIACIAGFIAGNFMLCNFLPSIWGGHIKPQYRFGPFLSLFRKRIMTLYTGAADSGNTEAQYRLGLMHERSALHVRIFAYALPVVLEGIALFCIVVFLIMLKEMFAVRTYISESELYCILLVCNLVYFAAYVFVSDVINIRDERDKARSLYLEAGNKGHAEAQYRLGMICDKEGNYSEAHMWFTKAAQNGHSGAAAKLRTFGKGYGEK